KSCSSPNLVELLAEIALHLPGLARLNMGHIFVFPEVVVCLDCGHLQAKLSADDLHLIQHPRLQSGPSILKDTTGNNTTRR
ncbi:MAG TPA: hypothetical protein VEV85_06755, partial [Bryobacteraceae bacterium]|nr:hypothetical protein [Bryobacteraceae bacterium]